MPNHHQLSTAPLTLEQLTTIFHSDTILSLSEESARLVQEGRRYLDARLSQNQEAIYGINTGFGAMHDRRISSEDLLQLQENLVRSHACGTGEEVPMEIVRLLFFLKIRNFLYGHSGVRLELVERMITLWNAGVMPVIYQQGSLGASGDLSPLAHLSLALLGLGEVHFQGRRCMAKEALEELSLPPFQLHSKEGLALLNGTQFSLAYGIWSWLKAWQIAQQADFGAALSCDVFGCHLAPFNALLHAVRPHPGQMEVAATIKGLLEGSPMQQSPKNHVQDPYAFRCIPQVHGASRDALNYAKTVFETELNAVTDNPTLFPEDGLILSGGNFHAQPLALVLDFMAIAVAELGSISERRIYQLISGQRGLPPFLTEQPGLHSGLMIPQYTAASIVSQSKQWCTPASVDSIVSSNGQEDHVSMAANAATKLYRVVDNTATVLAIEWLCATQALYCRRPLQTAPVIEHRVEHYRILVPPINEDRVFSDDIRATRAFLFG